MTQVEIDIKEIKNTLAKMQEYIKVLENTSPVPPTQATNYWDERNN